MVRRSVVLVMAAFFMLVVPAVFAEQGAPGMSPNKEMRRGMMNMTPEERQKKEEERINQRIDELTKRLNLTPQQQAQVKDYLTKTAAQIRLIMQEASAKIKTLLEADRASIKALLTEEQKAKLEQKPQGQGEGKGQENKMPPAADKK
jgi:small-conductance mechanosensitive channel